MALGETFSDWFRNEIDEGKRSGALDAPLATTVDAQLDMILGFMQSTGNNNLKEVVSMFGEKLNYPYETYAGRAMKKYKYKNNYRIKDLNLPFDNVKNTGLIDRYQQGAVKESKQAGYGLMNVFEAVENFKGDEWLRSILPDNAIDFYGLGVKPGEVESKDQVGPDVTKLIYDRERGILGADVEKLKSNELLWKAYNAVEDPDDPSGLNQPWNIAGAMGEMGPGMLLGALSGSVGTGASALSKGMQISSAMGLNTGFEMLKYQQHQDKAEAAFGIGSSFLEFLPFGKYLRNLNPVRKGQLISNWAAEFSGRFMDTAKTYAEKEGITKAAADKGFNFWDAVDKGELDMPFEWVKNPKRTAANIGKETRETPLGAIDAKLKQMGKKARDMYNSGIEGIGMSKEDLANIVPTEYKDNPYGYTLQKNIKDIKSYFSDKAEPFRLAAEEAGDKIQMDPAALQAFSGSKDLTYTDTYSILNRALKSINPNKPPEGLEGDDLVRYMDAQEASLNLPIKAENFANLSASQLAQVVKNLRQELSSSSGGFLGKSAPAVTEVKQWINKARGLLDEQDPSYSVPYNKSQKLYSESLSMFGESGEGTIPGLSKAYQDKDLQGLADIFINADAATLKKTMPWMNPKLRDSLVRANIERRIKPETLDNADVLKGAHNLDMPAFAKDMRDVNFLELKEVVTNPDGLNKLSALAGGGIEMASRGIGKVKKAFDEMEFDIGDLQDNPLRDVQDTLRIRTSRSKRPYHKYLGNHPTFIQKLKSVQKGADTYSDSVAPIYGPRAQKRAYKKQLKEPTVMDLLRENMAEFGQFLKDNEIK